MQFSLPVSDRFCSGSSNESSNQETYLKRSYQSPGAACVGKQSSWSSNAKIALIKMIICQDPGYHANGSINSPETTKSFFQESIQDPKSVEHSPPEVNHSKFL